MPVDGFSRPFGAAAAASEMSNILSCVEAQTRRRILKPFFFRSNMNKKRKL